VTEWRNWLGNQRCRPHTIHRPRDLDGLRSAMLAARSRGSNVHAVGTGHAFGPLVPTTGDLISTAALDRLVAEEDDVLWVGAGMHVGKLQELAFERGLAVTGTSIYPGISVGGLAATGSHGTGLGYGCFSDNVVGVRLMTPGGEVVEIRGDDARLGAAQVHLGALGVVHELGIRCVPSFGARVREIEVDLDETLASIDTIVRENDFVSLYWIPFTRLAWLHLVNRTTEVPTYSNRRRRFDRAVERLAHGTLAPLATEAVTVYAPRATPWALRAATSVRRAMMTDTVRHPPEAMHYLYTVPKLWDCSFAAPVERSAEAFGIWRRGIEESARRRDYPINIAVHMRFARASRAWLAPTYGRDSCIVEAVGAPSTPNIDAFYSAIADEMIGVLDARPHWGKMLHHVERLRSSYGANVERFRAVRDELDPDRTMRNPVVDVLLGERARLDDRSSPIGAYATP